MGQVDCGGKDRLEIELIFSKNEDRNELLTSKSFSRIRSCME